MKKIKITKEFIKANADKTLKEVFPEVCGLPKDFTGWVKSIKEIDVDWLMYFEKGVQKYGFDSNKEWWECTTGIKEVFYSDEVEANEAEIFGALKSECDKIGFKRGVFVKPLNREKLGVIDLGFKTEYKSDKNEFWRGGYCLFKDGKFAKRVETITKSEAEAILNKKII